LRLGWSILNGRVTRAVHLAIRQLSALYLTAASAYTVAIILSQHPVLADRAGEASAFIRSTGAEATVALDAYVVQPGWTFVRNESSALSEKVADAIESEMSRTVQTRVAEQPRVIHRQVANVVKAPHVLAAPKLKPFITQDGTPARNTTSPQTESDLDLRLSEAEPAPKTVTPSPATKAPATTGNAAPDVTDGQRVAGAVSPRPELQIAQSAQTSSPPAPEISAPDSATAVPNLPPPTTAEIAQVEERLKDNLTSEMFNNFELFLYVSKASTGPWSQRMFVFQKEPSGDLALAYNWPVSTGREKVEFNPSGQQLPTNTPAGYYELDPHRFFPHYVSGQWGEKMPYAMFFNWKKDGQQTGLAIHSASGNDVAMLGNRASAGCVRLPPEAARTLFTLIKSKYRGLTPRFAVDRRTGTMSNDGIILHDSGGKVQLADGYKVLVFIEDYGGENVVAAMY
jgi:lipoprotein-anchoring transpeptidase ErfK/SrfK